MRGHTTVADAPCQEANLGHPARDRCRLAGSPSEAGDVCTRGVGERSMTAAHLHYRQPTARTRMRRSAALARASRAACLLRGFKPLPPAPSACTTSPRRRQASVSPHAQPTLNAETTHLALPRKHNSLLPGTCGASAVNTAGATGTPPSPRAQCSPATSRPSISVRSSSSSWSQHGPPVAVQHAHHCEGTKGCDASAVCGDVQRAHVRRRTLHCAGRRPCVPARATWCPARGRRGKSCSARELDALANAWHVLACEHGSSALRRGNVRRILTTLRLMLMPSKFGFLGLNSHSFVTCAPRCRVCPGV